MDAKNAIRAMAAAMVAAASVCAQTDLTGRWKGTETASLLGGTVSLEVDFVQKGSTLTGTYFWYSFDDPYFTSPITGTISGSDVAFEADLGVIERFRGKLTGTNMIEGTVEYVGIGYTLGSGTFKLFKLTTTGPALTSLEPARAVSGGGSFILTVKGSRFTAGSMVQWNGNSRATSYISSSELRAIVLSSDIAAPGTALVTVVTPGASASNSLPFEIMSADCYQEVPEGSWKAEYFRSPAVEGAVGRTSNEGLGFLNLGWGFDSPNPNCQIPADRFAARFTRTVFIYKGRYEFTATVDGGARLYLDDRLLVDEWADQGERTHTVEVDLPQASHTVRLEYLDESGQAAVRLSWQKVGGERLGGGPPGGPVFALANVPGDPDTLYAGTMFGVFKTTNRGGLWSPVNEGIWAGPVYVIRISPDEPETVYAGGSEGLFKTTDGGQNWLAIPFGLKGGAVSSLLIHPWDPNTLYAGTADGLYRSRDAGQNWTKVLSASIVDMAFEPGNPEAIHLALSPQGILSTTDSCATWSWMSRQSYDILDPRRIAFAPDRPDVLYAAAGYNGIVKSQDRGATWTGVLRLEGSYHTFVAVDPQDSSTVYAYAGNRGLYRSMNGGRTWAKLGLSTAHGMVMSLLVPTDDRSSLIAGCPGGCMRSADSGETWQTADLGITSHYVFSLAVHPGQQVGIRAGSYNGLHVSDDGGQTWALKNWGMNGGAYVLAADALDPQRLYAMGSDGVYLTKNGGTNWRKTWSGNASTIAHDPGQSGVVYVGSGGIWKTLDGGNSWTYSTAGLPWGSIPASVSALAVSPSSRSVVYAGISGAGIYRTTDGGQSWTLAGQGLRTAHFRVLAVSPAAPSVVYAGVCDSSNSGVYRSIDWAASWSPILRRGCVNALAVDPRDGLRLYAAIGYTLWRSTDGGNSWVLGKGDFPMAVRSLAVDPWNSETIYAGTAGAGLWRSSDGGSTWEPVRGDAGVPAGQISASPNPCPMAAAATQCTSSIQWSTTGVASAVVAVRNLSAGGDEADFGFGPQGTGSAEWIEAYPNRYLFTLYDTSAGDRRTLASVEVSGMRPGQLHPCTVTDAGTGLSKSDPLSPSCPSTRRPGAYARYYSVSLALGRAMQVLARSTEFDVHAYLVGPDGTVVAENDDSGGGTDALIEYTAASAGTYLVEITSFGPGASGTFALTITPWRQHVYLIHGIAQGAGDMEGLMASLSDTTYGIDRSRFIIDRLFDYSQCANKVNCSADCTIENNARALALYINAQNPHGDIILVGYSLGGLVARDMMLNNYDNIFGTRRVAGLITLGTPNVGYPYVPEDTLVRCSTLVRQMSSDFRSRQSENIVMESTYLLDLNNRWGTTSFIGRPRAWFAASGTFCTEATRTVGSYQGCPDYNKLSDGVVCDQSARFMLNVPQNWPTRTFNSASYAHTDGGGSKLVLCGNWGGQWYSLFNPPASGSLVQQIKAFIEGL